MGVALASTLRRVSVWMATQQLSDSDVLPSGASSEPITALSSPSPSLPLSPSLVLNLQLDSVLEEVLIKNDIFKKLQTPPAERNQCSAEDYWRTSVSVIAVKEISTKRLLENKNIVHSGNTSEYFKTHWHFIDWIKVAVVVHSRRWRF